MTWQAPSSNGGSAVTGYKVQWKEAADSWDTAADVSQATETGTTYTITSLKGGVEYAVRVIATNDVGDGPASTEAKGTPAGGVSEQVVEPENSAPTGLPGISGTPQVDQTLTASHLGHRRLRWADQRLLQLPVDRRRVGHQRGHRLYPYPHRYNEQGQTIQVQGDLHRRR